MDNYIYICAGVIIVLFFLTSYIKNRANLKSARILRLQRQYGQVPDREYSAEEFDSISNMFLKDMGDRFYIDDITWNDLDMDRVFRLINNTNSSVGEEYLYKLLREPEFNTDKLREFDETVTFFDENPEERLQIQRIFCKLGRAKRLSLSDYLENFVSLKKKNTLLEWLNLIRFFIAIVVMIINVSVGMLLMIGVIIYNVISYFNVKADIGSYYICTCYISKLIEAAHRLGKRDDEKLSSYENELKSLSTPLLKIVNKTGKIGNGAGVSDGLLETLLEYKNMVFHTDIIHFYEVLDIVKENIDDIWKIYELCGKLEASIAVASFRNILPYYAKPEFDSSSHGIDCEDLYHILLERPVANSISEDGCVLLTGSNASGKSTFLKTVAINSLLSQTIYTSPSKKYKTGFFRLYSSMSLRDDLENGDSYYMVEIKALKRIMDATKEGDVPVLCFVDEVLRGTNTVERIAASGKILESLHRDGACVYAATHDIELTHMLEKLYSNYHFKEEVMDNDISFNYCLNKGRATTRNAIKLLGIMGYDESVIESANKCAENFVNDGIWSL